VYTRWYFGGAPPVLSSRGLDEALFLIFSSYANKSM
jgi:hypothetical protein